MISVEIVLEQNKSGMSPLVQRQNFAEINRFSWCDEHVIFHSIIRCDIKINVR